jgi:VWFA-related protein
MSSKLAAATTFALLFGTLPSLRAQAPFGERVEVTAIELMVDVRDNHGKVPADLKASDFIVLEDGKPQRIIGLEYVRKLMEKAKVAAAPEAAEPAPAEEPVAPPWRMLIYFDFGLSSPIGVRDAAAKLALEAENLVALGTVEIVAGQARPVSVLEPTRDAAAVRKALEEVGRMRVRSVSDVDFIRMGTASHLNDAVTGSSFEDPKAREMSMAAQALLAARMEMALLRLHGDRLRQYLSRYDERSPKALLFVTTGFETDPTRFYLPQEIRIAEVRQDLIANLHEVDITPKFDAMWQDVAARHWTVYAVSTDYMKGMSNVSPEFTETSPRGSQFAGGRTPVKPLSQMENTLAVLRRGAQLTGGDLALLPDKIGATIGTLGDRIRITYQFSHAPDDKMHNIQVKASRPGLKIVASQRQRSGSAAELAAARGRLLLVGGEERGELDVRCSLSEFTPAEKRKHLATLTIVTDVNALGEIRASMGNTKLRYSVVVEEPNLEPVVRQDVMSAIDLASRPGFVYDVPMKFGRNARKAAVVVEELTTGLWGSCVQEIMPPVETKAER